LYASRNNYVSEEDEVKNDFNEKRLDYEQTKKYQEFIDE